MIGAIIGDIVGSRFEFHNHLSKDFIMFTDGCTYTDDTVMTCAVADLLLNHKRFGEKTATMVLQQYGRTYPDAGYGVRFEGWVHSDDPKPYNSCGNGSAMRISPVGWVANTDAELRDMVYKVTAITHDHPEGLKGAEVIAKCIMMARQGANKWEILEYARQEYRMNETFFMTCEQWQNTTQGKHGKEICQVSVPQALACFREGNNFEDVIRNCVSIGGDTDTVAAIAGSVAEAYYGVHEDMVKMAYTYMPKQLMDITKAFRAEYCK